MKEFLLAHPWGALVFAVQPFLAFIMCRIFRAHVIKEDVSAIDAVREAMDGKTFNFADSREAFSTETENLDKTQSPGSKDRIDAGLRNGVLAFHSHEGDTIQGRQPVSGRTCV